MDVEARFKKIYSYLKKHDFHKPTPQILSRSIGLRWETANIYLRVMTNMHIFKQLSYEEKHYVSDLIKKDREHCVRTEEILWRNHLIEKLN